jgi:hypothetical protein
MEFTYENIEAKTMDAEQIEQLARLLAEIIFAQMTKKVTPDEEPISDMV